MREQLIQLIKQAHTDFLYRDDDTVSIYEFIADRLIEAGVILPPIRVGQTAWIPSEYYDKAFPITIERMDVYEEEIIMYSDGGSEWYEEDIGKTVFLTREAAEAALEAREKQ